MAKPAKSLIDALQDDARERAREAEKRLLYVAQKGARWKIREFFGQYKTPAWTAWGYLLLSLIGLVYSWSFYRPFEIPVFNFFDTSDFLLSAFHNMGMLVTGVFTILIGIWILFRLAYSSSIYLAYSSSIYLAADLSRKKQQAQVRWSVVVLLAIILGAFILRIAFPFFHEKALSLEEVGSLFATSIGIYLAYLAYLAYPAYRFIKFPHNPVDSRSQFIFLIIGTLVLTFGWGVYDNKAALKEKSRFVKVVLNKDFAQSDAHPLNPAPLLGTTSRFHFFYECENPLTKVAWEHGWSALKPLILVRGNIRPECENGRSFVIPTANIAALEFNIKGSDPGPGQVGLHDILDAIQQLNTTISDLNPIVKVGNIIFDATKVATAISDLDASSKTNAEEITEAIENLQSVVASKPDGLVTAIGTLSQSVQNLNPRDGSPPGSGEIATAINNLKNTVQNLHISVGKNYCASGLKKVETIGPFCKGRHEQLEEAGKECPDQPAEEVEAARKYLGQLQDRLITPDKFFGRMDGRFTNQQLLLIGRVDITQLTDEKRKPYGSNSGLAQARAKWILEKLKKRFPEHQSTLERTILLSAGPLHTGEEATEINRAKDRSVEVWACWTPKES